jgi:hypothetical protein
MFAARYGSQDGDAFGESATGTESCLGLPVISGMVSGTVLSGRLRRNTGFGTLDITFSGVVNGATMTINPTRLSFDAFDTPCFCGDACDMGGVYTATR